MTKLEFHHVGPPLEHTVAVPRASVRHSDYGLVYDPARRALVYVTAPDYPQVGLAAAFDGSAFAPISTTTYRLGSQDGPWTAVYDVGREVVVVWGFDSDSGPYGVVLGRDGLSVILHTDAVGDHESMSQTAKQIVVTGDRPGRGDDTTWDNLPGVFGYDPTRRVTVCVAQDGIFELGPDRWTRVADAPKLPSEVDGDRGYSSGGAAAVWDAILG